VRLTADGEKLLGKARAVLWAGEALIEEAGRQDQIEERLRLGVTELIACTWLQDFLRLLKTDYPKLRVQLEVDISTVIDGRLMEGHLDLALQSAPFKSKVSTAEVLGQEPYCWVACPALGAQIGPTPALEDLFYHTILTHAKHTQAGLALHQLAKDRGFGESQIVHSSALSACVPMALEGLGVALLPYRLVKNEIETGALIAIACDWLPDALSFHARYASHRAPLFVGKAAQIACEAWAIPH
jgi:DNA-binding transcriptional LysR family regulator